MAMLTTLREDIERFHIETGQKPSEWFMDVEGLPELLGELRERFHVPCDDPGFPKGAVAILDGVTVWAVRTGTPNRRVEVPPGLDAATARIWLRCEAEAAELRATIARMGATIRYLRDQYRTAVGLPTVPPEGTCPTCGSKKP